MHRAETQVYLRPADENRLVDAALCGAMLLFEIRDRTQNVTTDIW